MTRARLFTQFVKPVLNHRRKLVACGLLIAIGAVLTARAISTRMASIDATIGSVARTSNDVNVITSIHPAILQADRLPRILITIRPTGFDPDEIIVSDAPFLLAVDNKTGLDVVKLRLSREGSERMREVHLSSGRLKWREKMNLPTGNYVLTEAEHPNWRCRLTVRP